MLNLFWGKFGQNCNKSTTQQITQPAALLNLVDDPLVTVQDIRILGPDLVGVVHKINEEDALPGRSTSIFIAAFTK